MRDNEHCVISNRMKPSAHDVVRPENEHIPQTIRGPISSAQINLDQSASPKALQMDVS